MTRRVVVLAAAMWFLAASACWAAGTEGAPAAGAATEVHVTEIVMDASEILTDEEIGSVIEPVEGETVTIAELRGVVEQLNELYAAKNYVTAKAILPPQTIENGVVRIRLVEGHVGAISIQGNAHTRRSFFIDRMSLQPGDLVKLATLEADIAYFNGTNDVKIKAQLKPGTEFGMTDYVLAAVEPPHWRTTLAYDNTGRSETGAQHTSLILANSSLLAYQDPLTLSLMGADGALAGSFAYDFPVGTRGARVGVGYNKNQIDIISGEFESVDISGQSSGYNLSVTRPLYVRPQRKVYGSLALFKKESGNYFSNAKLLATDVKTLVAGISGQSTGDQRFLSADYTFTVGRGVSGSGVADFAKTNGNFEHQRMWGGNRLTLRAAVQLSPNRLLPSSEQFSIGGMANVRGFPAGMLTGDQGYFVSAQLNVPVAESFGPFAFLDHGAAFPYKGNNEPVTADDYITSVGVGAAITLWDHLSGTLSYGIPVRRDNWADDGLGRLHFRVQASF